MLCLFHHLLFLFSGSFQQRHHVCLVDSRFPSPLSIVFFPKLCSLHWQLHSSHHLLSTMPSAKGQMQSPTTRLFYMRARQSCLFLCVSPSAIQTDLRTQAGDQINRYQDVLFHTDQDQSQTSASGGHSGLSTGAATRSARANSCLAGVIFYYKIITSSQ